MLSIIIPTLNEEEGIARVLCAIPPEIRKQSEVIVVDVSSDFTPIIAERLGARVVRAKRKGKGWQMREAVAQSRGETLIFLDGDGTDPPEFIAALLKRLETANLVLGCRSLADFQVDDRAFRRYFKIYGFFIRPIFRLIGFRAGDPLAGFRAIRRKDWDQLKLASNDFEIETEMNIKAVKAGFVVKEVAIPHLRRAGGLRKSKLVANPRMWFKISRVFWKHFKDEKLKSKIKNFEAKLKAIYRRF